MTKQAMLDEARAAYHRLLTGGRVSQARGPDGREVRWDRMPIAELRAYINQLETELGLPVTPWTGTARIPARRVMF
ncbi:gpW family protein [Methylobacterium gregans]|uniref:Phage tail protein n=1 Tax=Methylobacterium gregans TaxID=374424 RepID=A0AA37HLJ0_9HYPH|nr:gpW family protein [Methylobacterium gregans]MDQ0521962.1 hypothetical protein [Methylobacterium gregans]GJD78004.1 hypothetical protein NBEOAGPD_1216 [Methylobacterium gregans]GLS51973.1 hypothetical protein GCM10007886_01550 [Methylobacterium gregans]